MFVLFNVVDYANDELHFCLFYPEKKSRIYSRKYTMVLQVLEEYFHKQYPGKYKKPEREELQAKTKNSESGTGD
ncbi:peptidoglycan glycosyltransferase [Kalymmatonema gypsitolerans NIES-4073]|nr:peptidoglycan glycosyltransferase [Scytonema sp. NIES-4073]